MPPSWRSSRHAPYPEPDLDNTDPNEEVALQSPSTRRHHRSKTVRRAAKRQRGELASQREVPAEEQQPSNALAEAHATTAGGSRESLWPDCDAWRAKAMFETYYKLQRIVAKEEWPAFRDALHTPLPVTFRFTRDVTAIFRAEGERVLTRWAGSGMARRLELVDGWQLHVDKHALRAAFEGTDEHVVREWLVRGTDDGSLIRQEVASMLPAVLLDVPEDACVLDMCASPGSKTTQVLEKLGPRGVVVANDFSPLRSYTLVRRTASLGMRAAAMVVTCHGAQKMPRPPRGCGGYDRIVCDVPCTGDGTTRKHPEVFQRWEPAMAVRHHPMQLQIAMRGAALLEVGGVMCYSTCSLNPIENEAVVAELLRRCDGAIELLDGAVETAAKLAGGAACGKEAWPVLDFRLWRHDNHAAMRVHSLVPPHEARLYKPSMWPPPAGSAIAAQLHRCARLVPHRSDSGGFFVALLKKVRPLRRHPQPAWPRRHATASAAADDDDGSDDGSDGHASDDDGGDGGDGGDGHATASARQPQVYAPLPPELTSKVLPLLSGGSRGDAGDGGDGGSGGKRAKKPKRAGKLDAALEARLFARSSSGGRVVMLSPEAARLSGGGQAAKGTRRLHVVHAGATICRRKRGAADRKAWRLTPVGKQLVRALASPGGASALGLPSSS